MKAQGNGFILISRIAMLFFITVMVFFIAASSISAFKKDLISFGELDRNFETLPTELFVKMLSIENAYFGQASDGTKSFSLTKILAQATLQFDYGDLRSFFGWEIPGLSLYHTEILVAGKGTDFTNLPYESAPPLDVLLQEREIAQKELEELTKDEPESPSPPAKIDKKVLIYHSHSYESYLPLLGLTGDPDMNKANDSKTNITLVGELLGKELESKGIGVVVDKTNIGQELKKKGWNTNKAYAVSRDIVQEVMANNSEVGFLIDIHRDAVRKEFSTTMIDGKPYARVFFIVGKANKNFEKNLKLATTLHESLELKHPGLSRGVFAKDKHQGNGVYNQDLSDASILVEIGGVDNDMKEIKNTVSALATVISEYLLNAEEVSAPSE